MTENEVMPKLPEPLEDVYSDICGEIFRFEEVEEDLLNLKATVDDGDIDDLLDKTLFFLKGYVIGMKSASNIMVNSREVIDEE